MITDAKGKVQELPKWAPAIVGARPTLEPGNCFEYYSRTDVDTRYAGGWLGGWVGRGWQGVFLSVGLGMVVTASPSAAWMC